MALVAPAGFSVVAGVIAYQAGDGRMRAGELPVLMAQIQYDAASELTFAQRYRAEPSAAVRAMYQAAVSNVVAGLDTARSRSHDAEVPMIDGLLSANRNNVVVVQALFAAVDKSDSVLANAIDRNQVEPAYAIMSAGIADVIEGSLAFEEKYDRREASMQFDVLVGTPLVLVLDLILVMTLLLLQRSAGRRARQAASREADIVRQNEQRFRALLQNASDVVLISQSSGLISYQSPTAETAWGYAGETLLGHRLSGIVHPEDQTALEDLWLQLQGVPAATRTTELRLRMQDGAWRYVELILTNLHHEAFVKGVVITARDIEERKAFEQLLTQRAFYDALTGLPNRLLFHDRLDQGLVRAARRRRSIGLLFLDLDNFKLINDGLGHAVGDQLLKEAAARLSECVRAEDTVARLGGDEFVVLLDCLLDEADAQVVAENISRQFRRPFKLGSHDVVVTASIGVTLGDASHQDASAILRDADVAMYRAKSEGKGKHVLFDASMHRDSLARLELENDLRQALEKNELRLHYQPIVEMHTNKLVEVEALVRWQHPTRGLIPPSDFITIAEETGMIVPLGHWVLEEACKQAAQWHAESTVTPPLTLSVNLSPRQFQQPDLDEEIADILQRTGMKASCLKLEITEGVIMRDVELTITMLAKLKALGLKLAVDDFGTGYSSLAYLKRLPLDVLKIDQSFVKGIGRNPEDTAIVQAILSLAQSLNLSVTGEGIETIEQATLLTSMSCDRGQGYFFAKPLDGSGITALLQATIPLRESTPGPLHHATSDVEVISGS